MLKKLLLSLHGDILFRNSFYLMLATGVLAGFGFLFWFINARLFSTDNIGIATTLISVMNLIALLSLLGFNAALVRFLPTADNRNEQINTSLVFATIASIALSLLFIAFVGIISPQLIFISQSAWFGIIFVFACVMTTLNTLTDSVFLAHRQTKYTLNINILYSVFKTLAPFAFISWGAMGIFTAAALAQMLGTLLSILALMRWFAYRPSLKVDWLFVVQIWYYNTANYLSTVLNLLPVTLLPIIVINHLGPKSAAYYYIAMMIANLLYTVPYATTKSLFAEGSHDEKYLQDHVRKSIRLITMLLIPAMVVLILGGSIILGLFGEAYASGGAYFLDLLTLAGIAVSIDCLYGALFQIKRNSAAIILSNVVYAVATLGLAYFFLPFGLAGIGIAWTLGNTITAVVSYVLYHYQAYLSESYENVIHERYVPFIYRLQHLISRVKGGSRPKVLLCYPEVPEVWHILYHIAHYLRLTISNDPNAPFDIALVFADTTVRSEDLVLTALTKKGPVINARCGDIRKTHVEEVFEKVFGYGMSVDPRTYTGAYVKKSEINAKHDGKILLAPSEPEAGYIYQRLINNTGVRDGLAADIRVFIMKDSIPGAMYRYKTLEDRFDQTIEAEPAAVDAAFSADELAKMLRFCKEFGLEYGELDVLRDKDDGKMYIVDVSNTPAAPRRGPQLEKNAYDKFIKTISESFASEFLAD